MLARVQVYAEMVLAEQMRVLQERLRESEKEVAQLKQALEETRGRQKQSGLAYAIQDERVFKSSRG